MSYNEQKIAHNKNYLALNGKCAKVVKPCSILTTKWFKLLVYQLGVIYFQGGEYSNNNNIKKQSVLFIWLFISLTKYNSKKNGAVAERCHTDPDSYQCTTSSYTSS
jgi:hypothetical protein